MNGKNTRSHSPTGINELKGSGPFGRFFYCPVSSEQQNLQQRLEKKEREVEAKNREKEEMMEMLKKMKDKLEREIDEHKQAKKQLEDLSSRLQQLSSAVRCPPTDSVFLFTFTST